MYGLYNAKLNFARTAPPFPKPSTASRFSPTEVTSVTVKLLAVINSSYHVGGG